MRKRGPKLDRYALYESAVQSPGSHVDFFEAVWRDLLGGRDGKQRRREPVWLREDFCGTFALSAEWVRRSSERKAVGVDLDPEPIGYGKRLRLPRLRPDARRRCHLVVGDVRDPVGHRADLTVACNFSFYVFRERRLLVEYLRAARRGLKPGGLLLLEMAGGPGMVETTRERKTLRRRGRKIQYIWDQKSFDPVSREGHYAIHFRVEGGASLRDAFTYHWRIWTIPEVREALEEAGFRDSYVYWEAEHEGEGTGEFLRTDQGDNAYAWIAYVVGKR